MTLSEKAEDNFIQRYFAPLAQSPEALGLHDDAAQIPVPDGQSLVISTDTLVSGVHFFDVDPPDTIAKKALRVNLSDLVAKGAIPKGYFLSLAMPEEKLQSDTWMSQFSDGLASDQDLFRVSLMGGDTVRTPGLTVISICAFGFVPQGKMVTRAKAKPKDRVYVTGTIGDSAIGLLVRQARLFGDNKLSDAERVIYDALTADRKDIFEQRYLVPIPKISAAPVILRFATASMDISDGLVGDANSLARVSNVGLELQLERIPNHALLADLSDISGLDKMLITGGDDYEILCTVSEKDSGAFENEMMVLDVPTKFIGTVNSTAGVRFVSSDNIPIDLGKASFDHFS
ncbi:MAG: thiamine-phosphate kinase [Hyphomicrobiales bacterium]